MWAVVCAAFVGNAGAFAQTNGHPLDPVLAMAKDRLERLRREVRDYTATLIKRERINGKLTEQEFLFVKIRHPQVRDGRTVVPFSVYLRYLRPPSVAGREAIWVEGRNGNKLIAHDAGLRNVLRYRLDPDGYLATMGNRYSIKDTGFLNLLEKLIEKGEQDRNHGECEVKTFERAKIDGRPCKVIQVTHPQRRDYFDYYRAQIFVDLELDIPIRYAAWSWPPAEGQPPVLEEEYTYRDVRLNVGLTDRDFDPDNPEYDFP